MTRLHSKNTALRSLALLSVVLFPLSGMAEQTKECLIADFDSGVINQLGGALNSYEKLPSRAVTRLSKKVYRGDSGRSLRISVRRSEGGFCGAWMQFFNRRTLEPTFFDMSGYNVLSFWVKGERGGEKFTVKLADESWIEKEDSVAIGSIDQFLPGGVTTEWQEVLVPLGEDAKWLLDLENMGGITFDFTMPGEYTIYVDNVSAKSVEE